MENVLHKNFSLGNYRLLEHIGKGSFASVWKAENIQTHCIVAIKAIKKSSLVDDVSRTRFDREINLMMRFKHPFIAEFFELIEDNLHYYIVMELAEGGNILEYVNKNGKLDEEMAKHYFIQIVSVLEYLHNTLNVAHRDIKCENVLIDKSNNIRIVDFGLSNVFTVSNPLMKTTCGSPAYAAPEMVSNQPYSSMADIWSTGILLFAICAGYLPYDDSNINRLLHKIVYTETTYPLHFSNFLADLIEKMLMKNPSHRMTLEEIKAHPWFPLLEYMKIQSICIQYRKEFEQTIDQDIVQMMRDMDLLGVEEFNRAKLGESNIISSVYKMLLREKLKDRLKELSTKSYVNKLTGLRPSKQITAPIVKPIQLNEANGHAKHSFLKTKPDFHINNPVNSSKQRRLSKPVTMRSQIVIDPLSMTKIES